MARKWLKYKSTQPTKYAGVTLRVSMVPSHVRVERGVLACGSEVRLGHPFVAEVPPQTAPKKIPTPESKFTVASFPHVKIEFRYRSGIVELGLGGFLRLSNAFFADFIFQ